VSRTATEDNVLAALDSRPTTAFYRQLTLPSAFDEFLFGYDTSSIGLGPVMVPSLCTLRPS
jgi:hypothetical protein